VRIEKTKRLAASIDNRTAATVRFMSFNAQAAA